MGLQLTMLAVNFRDMKLCIICRKFCLGCRFCCMVHLHMHLQKSSVLYNAEPCLLTKNCICVESLEALWALQLLC